MEDSRPTVLRTPAASACVGVLAILVWYGLTISANYGGDWTALFCTGEETRLPPELGASVYRFPGSTGYDGQFYRLVAHDPFLSRGYSSYADSAPVRWRRIFVPLLAWAVALGNPGFIDAAYALLILLFTGLGVYALSRWLALRCRHPAGGLAFLLLPGTLISIDRLTVDVALYALLFLCLVWDEEGRRLPVWVGLAMCALTRDLGVLVIGGFVLTEACALRFRRATWMATAVLPAAAWYAWLRHMLPSASGRAHGEVTPWLFGQPGYGIFLHMLELPPYPNLSRFLSSLTTVVDEIALAGMVLAIVLTLTLFRWRTAGKLEWTGVLFALLFFAVSGRLFWTDVFAWPRGFTPLLAALAISDRAPLRSWRQLPLAAVTLRVGLQFGTQMLGVGQALGSA